MEKLVILDYSDNSVHFYDVDPDAAVDEVYLDKLGYEASQCYYMLAESPMSITFHNKVLR